MRQLLALLLLAATLPAQVSIHPAVSVTRSVFPDPSGLWLVFDPVVDPFLWQGQPLGVTLEIREAHFLHPTGWTGACGVRLTQVLVVNTNPTQFAWATFHTWPKSPNTLQTEIHSRVLGNQLVLPPGCGWGLDYGVAGGPSPCVVGGQTYARPLLVAVLLEVR